MRTTTSKGLQAPRDAPLISGSAEESFNSMSLQTPNHRENSKSFTHVGSGYNTPKKRGGGMSAKHNVFVVGFDGKPLTPTTNAKVRKLMEGKQAKPVWNKFGKFGIQMVVPTRKNSPKTALGTDFGTKFEGYAVTVGKENNLSVMWKLPDKKKIVRKLEERRRLRRARRQRKTRRRPCKFDNRGKDGFIAPSQLVIVNSRLKCLQELFKCYPINTVAMEDVRFNHYRKRWGKNFSTVEIGKKKINDWIRERACLQFFTGMDTEELRKTYGYKKSSNKGGECFNSHCSDALALATDIYAKQHIEEGCFIVVDDTYRCVRRRLHDTQPSKGGIRYPYSTGNFKNIRKGTLCEYGQICGGTKETVWIRDTTNKRTGKTIKKVGWMSHNFKICGGENGQFLPTLTDGVSLPS